jgi:hypothetical protein
VNQTPLSATLGADYKRGAFSAGGSFVFKSGGEVRLSSNQVAYESGTQCSRTIYPGSPTLRATLEMNL